jgi:retron-type reverse transcriptase
MKRIGNLWGEIVSFGNLWHAAREARRGKRFRDYALAFHADEEREVLRLRKELLARAYRPGPYRTFTIVDPKTRLISAAPYRDRVVHHALVRVLEPIFERTFIDDSYACREGKGNHAAMLTAHRFMRASRYVLKCDIRKFFPSVDHEILRREIARKIKCEGTLWLVGAILDGSNPQEAVHDYFPGDDLFAPFERRRGLPIGNLTSQFFGNVYLNGFDHFVKEELRCRRYVRYVDDFLVLDDSKDRLLEVRARMDEHLAAQRLRLHEDKTVIAPTAGGVNFLGFRRFPTHRTLTSQTRTRQRRRLKALARAWAEGEAHIERVRASVTSAVAHDRWGDTYAFRRILLSSLLFQKGADGTMRASAAARGATPT